MLYLDNAATSFPKPPAVLEAFNEFMREIGVTPRRGLYRAAAQSAEVVEQTRRALATLFNLPDQKYLAFTYNATDALNIAIKGILNPGDHVITTLMEHNSVLRPLRRLELTWGITVTRLVPGPDGVVPLEKFEENLLVDTKMVIVQHASNAFGTLQELEKIGAWAKEKSLFLLVDAAQTAGQIPIDVQKMHIDALAFTGHKSLYGFPGVGGLYVAPGADQPRHWREGGTGSSGMDFTLQPDDMPTRLEAGTPNTPGIAGLGAGLRFIEETGIDKIRAHEEALISKLLDFLNNDERFRVFGPKTAEGRTNVVSFKIAGLRSDEAATILDASFDIAVRSGAHCAPYSHQAMGTFPDGTVRVSPGFFNTEADIDKLIDALKDMAKK